MQARKRVSEWMRERTGACVVVVVVIISIGIGIGIGIAAVAVVVLPLLLSTSPSPSSSDTCRTPHHIIGFEISFEQMQKPIHVVILLLD